MSVYNHQEFDRKQRDNNSNNDWVSIGEENERTVLIKEVRSSEKKQEARGAIQRPSAPKAKSRTTVQYFEPADELGSSQATFQGVGSVKY